MSGSFLDGVLKTHRRTVKKLQRAGDALQELRCAPLWLLVRRPHHIAYFDHRREAVFHRRGIALRFKWVAPRPVDAQAALARGVLTTDVVLVIGAGGRRWCVHEVVPGVIQLVLPRAASQRSAFSPGRKK